MRSRPALITLLAALVACVAAAGSAGSGYDKPPQNVLDVLHAPSPPSPYVSPTRDRILLVSWVRYPPIAQVAEPFLRLAGVRVEPRTRRKHDTPGGYGIAPCAQTLTLVDVATSREIAGDAAAGRLRGRLRVGRRRAGASRSETPRRTPSSSGSATPRRARSGASATRG